jgi:Methyltransferase domain
MSAQNPDLETTLNATAKVLLAAASFTPYPFKAPSAWLGHLPFASYLTRIFKPTTFVELGSHRGHSYFSFCQAVAEASLATKCYAVDTWQGDEHAGNYDEEVYIDVNHHNQTHYAGFSHLLRMTFDDALSHFPDGSVDLLHIDGLHTYEAVKHDFDTWLPKLAPGAVVLFHDTNVRERGFGVWKLWEELQMRYPSNMEFLHSYGLGVLQISGAADSKKLTWLDAHPSEQESLKKYFSALGAKQLEQFELANLTHNLMLSRQREEDLFSRLEALHKHSILLNAHIANLESQRIDQLGKIEALQQSTSWRMTAPLRSLLSVIPVPIKKHGRRLIKAIYWALTPWNIPSRIKHIKRRNLK